MSLLKYNSEGGELWSTRLRMDVPGRVATNEAEGTICVSDKVKTVSMFFPNLVTMFMPFSILTLRMLLHPYRMLFLILMFMLDIDRVPDSPFHASTLLKVQNCCLNRGIQFQVCLCTKMNFLQLHRKMA